jgi:hypothetical protein
MKEEGTEKKGGGRDGHEGAVKRKERKGWRGREEEGMERKRWIERNGEKRIDRKGEGRDG